MKKSDGCVVKCSNVPTAGQPLATTVTNNLPQHSHHFKTYQTLFIGFARSNPSILGLESFFFSKWHSIRASSTDRVTWVGLPWGHQR